MKTAATSIKYRILMAAVEAAKAAGNAEMVAVTRQCIVAYRGGRLSQLKAEFNRVVAFYDATR